MSTKIKVSFILNQIPTAIEVDPSDRTIDVLRLLLNRTETKEGCGIGECGACTILVNNLNVNSCIIAIGQLEGANVITIEGLKEDDMVEIIKHCFVEEGAVQCGYCTPGMLLSTYVLLQNNNKPDREEIKRALSGNLCRCTGYIPIINAVEKARNELNSSAN